jgi:hypothetical protein
MVMLRAMAMRRVTRVEIEMVEASRAPGMVCCNWMRVLMGRGPDLP